MCPAHRYIGPLSRASAFVGFEPLSGVGIADDAVSGIVVVGADKVWGCQLAVDL